MTLLEFANLVGDGVHPVIEFQKDIEEKESYAEPRMRARVTHASFDHTDGLVNLRFDYSEFEDLNKPIETSNYYDRKGNPVLTAREAGKYRQQEACYFESEDDSNKYFTVVEDTSLKLYGRFVLSGTSLSYAQWLERNLAEAWGISLTSEVES